VCFSPLRFVDLQSDFICCLVFVGVFFFWLVLRLLRSSSSSSRLKIEEEEDDDDDDDEEEEEEEEEEADAELPWRALRVHKNPNCLFLCA
jgi:amino acid permease